jgi:DNA-binding GntR family transcriptional regulator
LLRSDRHSNALEQDVIVPPANTDTGTVGVVYREIKRRITELVYQPGDKLTEVKLANEFGIGRSPVRTALSRLQHEGWIEVLPQSGTFVRGLSDVEIIEILEARIMLESYLAGRAARTMDDADIAELRLAFANFRTQFGSGRIDEYLELDQRFHVAIYKAAASSIVADFLFNLIDKVRWIRRGSARNLTRFREAYAEIKVVLDAIEARNEEAASTAMRSHIENFLEFRTIKPPRRLTDQLAQEP